MVPQESTIWDCHGTGTLLGDPIEVGTIKRIQDTASLREEPLLISTNKTYMGHLEGGAAMTTLLIAVLQTLQAVVNPFVHLRVLNPHLDTEGLMAHFQNEFSQTNHQRGNNHVSSFGFGGTNGHAIFWGQRRQPKEDLPARVAKVMRMLPAPEVRVIGRDPADWEMDGPPAKFEKGKRYHIVFPDDTTEPLRWEVEDASDEETKRLDP